MNNSRDDNYHLVDGAPHGSGQAGLNSVHAFDVLHQWIIAPVYRLFVEANGLYQSYT